MFLLPPFIWGLVELYTTRPRLEIHVITLLVNGIVLVVIGGISYGLIHAKKLHVPSVLEWKYLLFGLTGNTVVYFYTFQNNMNIDKYVTIYLILLIVLVVHYFLISHKIGDWELWILLPIFLILDAIHLAIWGCPTVNTGMCLPNSALSGWLYLIYVPIIILIFGYYGYKIYLYKRRDFFGLSNIGLVVILAILFQFEPNVDDKIIGTLAILLAFLGILHFIVSIVNKTYDHTILLHYIRTSTLLFLAMLMGEIGFFTGEANTEILIFMIAATYVSLFIVILKYLLHIEIESLQFRNTFIIRKITPSIRQTILEEYGEVAFDHISMSHRSLSLAAFLNDEVVGFVSTKVKPFPDPLSYIEEAYVDIIEVHKDHRRQQIATKLMKETEHHFKKERLPQLRGWSSTDKKAALQLWHHLGYQLSPTTVYYKDKDLSVEGFYFLKKL
jgi:GNAT superfamily N-acetyltransferase